MRKALIVGIDYYQNIKSLQGCVNDAYNVKSVLERHSDGTINFGVNLLVATDANSLITRKYLKDKVAELFRDNSDVAFFYFSGHGYLESTGGYLITSDCSDGDDGLSMNELLVIANANEDNVKKFRLLQKYNRVNLVLPVGEEHMYYAAMNSKSCKLTVLGIHYWNLIKRERI